MNNLQKTIFAALLMTAASTTLAQSPASSERLDQVAEHGRHVMPFNLEKTQHVFKKTEHGGIQQVVVKDASDQEQIRLINQHLSDISERFKQGDFSKQRRIHGDDMPGLAELAAANGAVHFDYRPLPNGAEIEFSAEDSSLVDAIHRFFNAQLRDHARHAIDGNSPHCDRMHHKKQHHKHHHCKHQHDHAPQTDSADN
jgi:hypothetical protein